MKNNSKNSKLPITMFIVWLISYFVIGIILTYVNFYRIVNGIVSTLFFGIDSMVYVILFIVIGYFLPTVAFIHHKAKEAHIKWLVLVSAIILAFFSVLAIGSVIVILGAILLT